MFRDQDQERKIAVSRTTRLHTMFCENNVIAAMAYVLSHSRLECTVHGYALCIRQIVCGMYALMYMLILR